MRRIAEGVRNYIRAAALSNGGAGTTLAQQVAVILAKYGTDAHVYLPGIGVINGLTAGNYLDSAGTTLATVDNPVGLVLDAAGSVGSELLESSVASGAGWASVGTCSAVGNSITFGTQFSRRINQVTTTEGRLYRFQFTARRISGNTSLVFYHESSATGLTSPLTVTDTATTYTLHVLGRVGGGIVYFGIQDRNASGFGEIEVTGFTVKEVTGIHATQSTTADKMILRRTAGRYWWDAVDATDKLTMTFPAGYESSTTIDAAPAGQATLTAQNIVGTYAITTDTYGRFVFKTITASELAIVQSYCNRLAGV